MNSDRSYLANTEATLRELILRVSYRPGDPRIATHAPQLFVGELPPDLPFTLPLPEGSTILGSFWRDPTHAEALLDSSQSPNETLEFYREHFVREGWSEQVFVLGNARFTSTSPIEQGTFCGGKRGPSLRLLASKGKAGYSDVRLFIQGLSSDSPCAQRIYHNGMQPMASLPTLYSPSGGQQRRSGSSGGHNQANMSASLRIEEDQSLIALSEHYANQLEQAGWKRLEGGEDGPLAWHIWSFEDEEQQEWRGRFLIFKLPAVERTYHLHLEVHWADLAPALLYVL